MRSKTENSSFVGFQQNKLQVIMEKPEKLFFIPRNLVWKAIMWNFIKSMRDFRLQPRSRRKLRSFGISSSVGDEVIVAFIKLLSWHSLQGTESGKIN
jgi:hypothetical protein